MLGPLQQLHSVEAVNITFAGPYINSWWAVLLVAPLYSYLLHMLLGWPGLLGTALMVGIQIAQIIMSGIGAVHYAAEAKCANQRLHRIAEVVQSMRVVKFMSWEDAVERTIEALRQQELGHMRSASAWRTIVQTTLLSSSTVISLGVFGARHRAGTTFEPADVMTAVILMSCFRQTLFRVPPSILHLLRIMWAVRRVEAIAENEGDAREEFRSQLLPEDAGLVVRATNVAVFSGASPVFGPVNFVVPAGKVTVVWGPTGSGKSLLLQAMAGEVRLRPPGSPDAPGHGSLRCVDSSRIAVAPQEAWIYTASVRDNIALRVTATSTAPTDSTDDCSVDASWYQTVVEACQLGPDLAQLPHGDMTVVGERGVTVSGGQRQRIALARAFYAVAKGRDVLLLDDPLSAVDAHVGHKLLHGCLLGGIGAGTTRVVATNRVQLLHHADHCIVLDGSGGIAFQGTPSNLLSLEAHQVAGSAVIEGLLEQLSATLPSHAGLAGDYEGASVLPPTSETVGKSFPIVSPVPAVTDVAGRTSETIFWYSREVGWLALVTLVLSFVVARGLQVMSELVLVWWTTRRPLFGNTSPSEDDYFTPFATFCAASAALCTLIAWPAAAGTQRASARIHAELVDTLLRAPIRTFDVTPTATLIKNFGQAMTSIDYYVPQMAMIAVITLSIAVGNVAVGTYGSWWVLLAFGLGTAATVAIVLTRFPGIRVVRQLAENYFTTPSCTLVEVLGGISVVRSFGQMHQFREQHRLQARRLVCLSLGSCASLSWLTLRMLIATAAATAASMFIIVGVYLASNGALLLRGPVGTQIYLYASARLEVAAGMLVAVAFVPLIPHAAAYCFSCMSDTDLFFSVADQLRIFITTLPQEDTVPLTRDRHSQATGSGASQPLRALQGPEAAAGEGLRLDNVSARYAPHLPLVLCGVTCSIPAGARVSIVGRTGSGKSSLALALMGMMDLCPDAEGRMGGIYVHGRDASQFSSKRELRQHFAFIPQDPVLFAGTVRSNLDPYGLHADDKLLEKIAAVGLLSSRLQQSGLETSVAERGGNFSQGERQLLCLARALLKPQCRVIIMDEATASVDMERDEAIHEIIRSGLEGYTVLSIAHRLHTLHRADLVLVLDRGVAAEFAPPRDLLACLPGSTSGQQSAAPAELSRLAALVLSLGPQEAARIVSMVCGPQPLLQLDHPTEQQED
jgi:ABC-type multidrug transport system fused ATPase/permease subunit